MTVKTAMKMMKKKVRWKKVCEICIINQEHLRYQSCKTKSILRTLIPSLFCTSSKIQKIRDPREK